MPTLGKRTTVFLLAGLLAALPACKETRPALPTAGTTAATTAAPQGDPNRPGYFRDMTAATGIDCTYRNGEEAGHYVILESLGGGVALIDHDGDGRLDVFLPGGGYFDGPDKKVIRGHPSKLYKNLGDWKFKDVTEEVGLNQPLFYTHGAAVGDYDNDGWPDLLVTGWGRLALYHNESDGKGGRRFAEVAQKAGLPEGLWTTSAAWADLDGDGFADLYVCQYVDWSWQNNPPCPGYSSQVKQDVCPPKQFSGLPHKVFRNNGNGTFTDVSAEAGLKPPGPQEGKGLGVVVADLDGDYRPDVYVANDTTDNYLYLNQSTRGRIRFREVGFEAGVARDENAAPNGSMGVDVADYDGQGRASVWVTNYENEVNALYRNQGNNPAGNLLFSWGSISAGIVAIGQRYVAFGTGFLDLDNDGWEDLVISNGHVIRHPFNTGLKQRPVLLRNQGRMKEGGPVRYAIDTDQGGPYFRGEHLGRGLAVGDLDNDGWPDVVVSHVNAPVAVLCNEAKGRQDKPHHWLGLHLVGEKHRSEVGAKIILEAGSRKLTRFAKGGGSYISSGDRRHLFGLGNVTAVDKVSVTWPGGKTQTWPGSQLATDRYWRLTEGVETASEK